MLKTVEKGDWHPEDWMAAELAELFGHEFLKCRDPEGIDFYLLVGESGGAQFDDLESLFEFFG
jgi:hypothetical protein